MDQRGTVINEGLGGGLANPGPVAAGNEGNTKGMKRSFHASQFERLVDATVFILRKVAGRYRVLFFQSGEHWRETGMNWDGEELRRIIRPALSVTQAYRLVFKVDVFEWNSTFGKPASGVESYFHGDPHPLGLTLEILTEVNDVLVGQLGFELLRHPPHSEFSNRVTLQEVEPDRLIEKLAQEFQFKQRGIVAGFTPEYGRELPPGDVVSRVPVLDLTGIDNPALFQERANSQPRCLIPSGAAVRVRILRRRGRPVGRKVAGNPMDERSGIAGSAHLSFLGAYLLRFALRLAGIGLAVVVKAGRMFFPFAGVKVAGTQEPIGRSGALPKIGHAGDCPTLPYLEQLLSWPVLGRRRETAAQSGAVKLPLHYEASLPHSPTGTCDVTALSLPYFDQIQHTRRTA